MNIHKEEIKKSEGLDSFFEYLSQRVRSKSTQLQYLSCVNTIYKPLTYLRGIDDELLLKLLNNKIQEINKDTNQINRNMSRRYAYKYLLKFLNKPDLVDRLVRRDNLPRRQKRKDIPFSIINSMAKRAKFPDRRLLIMLLADTGARISAIMDAKKEDVGIDGEQCYIALTEKKTGTSSTKYLSRKTSELLINQIKRMNDNDYIFSFRTTRRAAQIIKELSEKYSPHWFRHSKAVTLFRQGYNILDVAELLDHRSIESTRQYLKASGITSKKAMKKNEPKWREDL